MRLVGKGKPFGEACVRDAPDEPRCFTRPRAGHDNLWGMSSRSDSPEPAETTQTETFSPQLLEKVDALPTEPGVYLFKSESGAIIYVGKAKSLRSRVRSYFQRLEAGQFKTVFLVRRIADLDYIVTRNEKEALLLENTLIKKHRPRYNIRLRDDKDYVSLRIDTRQEWPKIEVVRRPTTHRDVLLFGPYSSAGAVRETVKTLQRVFPLRPCTNGKFTQYRRRGRPCMDYQLKKCPGPCNGLIGKDEYDALVKGAAMFLRGKRNDLAATLKARMSEAAANEEFEKAAVYRDRLTAMEQTLSTQRVAAYTRADSHVIGVHREGEMVSLVVLELQEGKLVAKHEHFFADLPEDDDVILSDFIFQFYLFAGDEAELGQVAAAKREIPSEIIVPVEVSGSDALGELLGEAAGRTVKVLTPRRGARADLRDTAERNAVESLRKHKEEQDLSQVPLKVLQEKLHLRKLPHRIECFDISNTMGTGAVGSMVVFTGGEPDRAQYRRFKIKTVMQADDFGMMYEVLRRRLSRGRDEGNLPDLIIVDGGKGQLSVAVRVIREIGIDSVELAGLAKARVQDDGVYATEVRSTEERLFLPNRKNPVILSRNSSALHMVTRLRDEAHRFAITYHRHLRKRGLRSALADIPGVGPKRQRALLRHFGSVKAMRAASADDLAGVEGMSKAAARNVFEFLRSDMPEKIATESLATSDPSSPG